SFFFDHLRLPLDLHSFPTRRSSDLSIPLQRHLGAWRRVFLLHQRPRVKTIGLTNPCHALRDFATVLLRSVAVLPEPLLVLLDKRSEEHTSELQSLAYLVCRLLLEKK